MRQPSPMVKASQEHSGSNLHFMSVESLSLCCCVALSFPNLPCLSFQCLFFLHWSDSAALSEADHLPLLSTRSVHGAGGDWPAQTHALERGEACQRELQGKPRRKHWVVSAARSPPPLQPPTPPQGKEVPFPPYPICVFQLLPVLRGGP